MNEALRNLTMLMWAMCAINSESYAQMNQSAVCEENMGGSVPTVIYGASRKAPGDPDEFVVEQAAGSSNPLGSPIVTETNADSSDAVEAKLSGQKAKSKNPAPEVLPSLNEELPQNPPVSPQDSPQQVNEQIQNTLYKSGDRIYDVQSYPASDINTISEPNIDPTINSYPSY